MRSNSSTTAISLATLWAGLPANATESELTHAPLIWDYAQAAAYSTAYWTSQNLLSLNARIFVQDIHASPFVTGSNLDPLADLGAGASDSLLVDRVLHDLPAVSEPFLAVVHFSNTHAIPIIDPNDAPFQPIERIDYGDQGGLFEPLNKWVALGRTEHLRNYYMNAVYLSDKAVGRLIDGVRAAPSGPRTVIVYTSDHGEALKERNQYGHTYGLSDDQIRVPAWIDAPPGTLGPSEERNLRSVRNEPIWHIDLAATLIDLLGLSDAPDMVRFKARMPGHSLLREERTTSVVPITNCSWIWECKYPNVGVMQGARKLWSEKNARSYSCFDVVADPYERNDLGEGPCSTLHSTVKRLYINPWESKAPHMPLMP
jgi:membrane-anchored protein YejM (alkaline phosphatase superfamily)